VKWLGQPKPSRTLRNVTLYVHYIVITHRHWQIFIFK